MESQNVGLQTPTTKVRVGRICVYTWIYSFLYGRLHFSIFVKEKMNALKKDTTQKDLYTFFDYQYPLKLWRILD